MCGAKYPPAPATSAGWKGMRIDSAHMALLSDCFSKATVSTRLCTPALTRPAAPRAVEPPPLPAVCTRILGLPVAPRASARYSSGITTPSNMSGALPMPTASTSFQPTLASSRARMAASRHRPAMETSSRLASCLVWPTPVMATRSAISVTLQDRDEVLLQGGARRGVRHRPVGVAVHDPLGGLDDAQQAGDHHGIGGQRAARR